MTAPTGTTTAKTITPATYDTDGETTLTRFSFVEDVASSIVPSSQAKITRKVTEGKCDDRNEIIFRTSHLQEQVG